MAAMQEEINRLNSEMGKAEKMYGQVQDMFNKGYLKAAEDGTYVPVTNPAESEHLRSEHAKQTKRKHVTEADIDRINADLDKMEGDEDLQ